MVVITGASSGLGEAAARYLSRHGAKLVLIEPLDGKTVDWMEKVSNEPYQAGFRAEY